MAALHEKLVVVDGHCDSAQYLLGSGYEEPGVYRDLLVRSDHGHLDLPRLKEAGVTCQTFALWADDDHVHEAAAHTDRLLDTLEPLISTERGFFPVRSVADILRAKAQGRVGCLLSMEGGEAIGESLDKLREYHKRGVRMIGLTWNRRNAIARGVGENGTDGLTAFGRKVVAEMAKLGVVVDVSHLADESLDDVLAMTELPVVASHSNSRVLCPHRRCLTDRQVERIAATGGLVGLCFAGLFIDPDPAKVTFDRLMAHLDRLIAVAGTDHVGLGSDFDGYTAPFGLALDDCLDLPRITAHLQARGHSDEEIAAVMGGNWMRVFGACFG